MLTFDDERWITLKAGYRKPIDLRPLLHALESSADPSGAWEKLWQELYHQGDVGEGSYAAVPHLVRIHRKRGVVDWNTYALTAAIELARDTRPNPDVPAWTRESYEGALRDLARLGLDELPRTPDMQTTCSILAILAIVHGARTYGRILAEFTEDEIVELEQSAFGGAVVPPPTSTIDSNRNTRRS
jgi:hypothetical protein